MYCESRSASQSSGSQSMLYDNFRRFCKNALFFVPQCALQYCSITILEYSSITCPPLLLFRCFCADPCIRSAAPDIQCMNKVYRKTKIMSSGPPSIIRALLRPVKPCRKTENTGESVLTNRQGRLKHLHLWQRGRLRSQHDLAGFPSVRCERLCDRVKMSHVLWHCRFLHRRP